MSTSTDVHPTTKINVLSFSTDGPYAAPRTPGVSSLLIFARIPSTTSFDPPALTVNTDSSVAGAESAAEGSAVNWAWMMECGPVIVGLKSSKRAA